MKVFYRMSPKVSVHEAKRPRDAFNKLVLADRCLRSFIEGFADIKPHIHFLLDACSPDWTSMIIHNMKWDDYKVENLVCNSQSESYLIQLDRAKGIDDYVLFQEDDYIYLKNVGKKIEAAMKELEFVNPYDHMEFYTKTYDFHKGPFEIKLIGDQHWRTIDFNTMTWGCHSGRLSDYWDILHRHGFWDKNTWDEMVRYGAKLWSPIPSLCTHMHMDYLSPGINWERRFCELD